MNQKKMTIELLRLAAKNSKYGPYQFDINDYINICAKIYNSKKMSDKTALKHLGWNSHIIVQIDDDKWELIDKKVE